MRTQIYSRTTAAFVLGVLLVLAACSSKSAAPTARKGRVVVAVTIDWEGAYISPEGLDTLDEMRRNFPGIPYTHFVSAGYFTKPEPDPTTVRSINEMFQKGDELAVHLHGWKTLAEAAKITPKLAPSFLTGTDQLLEFEDDIGFDVDLDAYSVPELRALLRTSKQLLEQTQLPISKSFRAGGYLGTPKVLQAAVEEGFTIDSSAADHRQLDERKGEVLPSRIQAIWPDVDATSQPWKLLGGKLLEMPIAAFADYATGAEIVAIVEGAAARLAKDPSRDVFVVLGFHQENATEFGPRISAALTAMRDNKAVADVVLYTTIEGAATRALPVAPTK